MPSRSMSLMWGVLSPLLAHPLLSPPDSKRPPAASAKTKRTIVLDHLPDLPLAIGSIALPVP